MSGQTNVTFVIHFSENRPQRKTQVAFFQFCFICCWFVFFFSNFGLSSKSQSTNYPDLSPTFCLLSDARVQYLVKKLNLKEIQPKKNKQTASSMKGDYASSTCLEENKDKSLPFSLVCSPFELWIFHNEGGNLALTLHG